MTSSAPVFGRRNAPRPARIAPPASTEATRPDEHAAFFAAARQEVKDEHAREATRPSIETAILSVVRSVAFGVAVLVALVACLIMGPVLGLPGGVLTFAVIRWLYRFFGGAQRAA